MGATQRCAKARLPAGTYDNRSWVPGNNPKTAVHEYLTRLQAEGRQAVDGRPLALVIDKSIENRLQVTVAPDGYLRRPE